MNDIGATLAELRRWRDKVRRRGKATDWQAETLSAATVKAIRAAQDVLTDPADAFAYALKAGDEWRDEAEADMEEALAQVLATWRRKFAGAMAANDPLPYAEFAAALDGVLHSRLTTIMVTEALRHGASIGVAFDPAIVNTAALQWAKTYNYDLVTRLTDTTRKGLQEVFTKFQTTPGMTRGDLEALLEPTFGQPRASMIAVTEVTRSASAATRSYQAEIANAGITMERVWHTRNDERTCPICEPLNGLPEAQWGDLAGTDAPPAHVNCILPGNIVAVPGLMAGARSRYAGKAIELITAGGRHLTVTENHPILTVRGWVSAQLVREGDKVGICTRPEGIASSVYPDYDHVPTRIEQVFEALAKHPGMITVAVKPSAEEFHGDGRAMDGDIEIVRPDGLLLDDIETRLAELIGEVSLYRRDVSATGFPGTCASDEFVLSALHAAYSLVSSGSKLRPLQRRHSRHAQDIGLGTITPLDAALLEYASDNAATDAIVAAEFQLRYAKLVSTDYVVSIRQFDFAGHVYDLQSALYGLYSCNSVLVKNCRCADSLRLPPLPKGEA
jgi:hypothetical protein